MTEETKNDQARGVETVDSGSRATAAGYELIHTALPWRVHFEGTAEVDATVVFPNGESLDDYGGWMYRADAEFLVRAVNSHGDLLAALKALLSLHDDPCDYDRNTTLAAARAAIAKAEGR